MTTCGNSKADGTIGVHDVTGLYTNDDIYDKDFPQTACNDTTVNGMGWEEEFTEYLCDDTAMMNYFSACDGQRHDYALFDYFCTCENQYFDLTMGTGINYFNFISSI